MAAASTGLNISGTSDDNDIDDVVRDAARQSQLADWVDRVEKLLECPICYETLKDANETNCGHSFCEFCINKCLEHSLKCPVCNKNAAPVHPSFTLRKLVDLYAEVNPSARTPRSSRATAESLKQSGNEHYNASRYANAIEDYTAALQLALGRDHALYGNRAQCYIKLRQYQRAMEDLQASLKINPGFTKALVRLALCQEALNLKEDCKTSLTSARAQDRAGVYAADIEACWNRICGISVVPPESLPSQQPRASQSRRRHHRGDADDGCLIS